MNLWNETPGLCEEIPTLTPYLPAQPKTDLGVIVFPGGGYSLRSPYEGKGYAEFLANAGIPAFVADYRVYPHRFPLPLLDARRAVRQVRANAAAFGVDPEKVWVMGSSAGAHLAALCCTYTAPLPFEGLDDIDRESGMPNGQILCYPVIVSPDEGGICHRGSYENLMGDRFDESALADPAKLVTAQTPPAFIWHTADDNGVDSRNSLLYAAALRAYGVETELHIFPHGPHGMGLAQHDPSVSQWTTLLLRFLERKLGKEL